MTVPEDHEGLRERIRVEAERIRNEFARRDREVPGDLYALSNRSAFFAHQQRLKDLLKVFRADGIFPLESKHILDVGCGSGSWLHDLEPWGATRACLHGIDLGDQRVAAAQVLLPGADIRQGDATALPWPDEHFDVVHQSTVFTSVLDALVKEQIAREMMRVLKPGGAIVWFDFAWNNPWNASVRGIGRKEVARLFPGFTAKLRRVTLAPPLMRRIVPVTWFGASLLEATTLLNSHLLGTLRRA